MPDKERDLVSEMLSDIRASLVWREEYEDTWMRTIEYLKGKYIDPDKEEETDEVCINMVRPHVSVVIPAIYSKNPDLLVHPTRISRQGDELARKRAEVVQNVMRYQMRELELKTEVKLAILDGLICGHAWGKTGYSTEFENLTEDQQQEETLISRFLKLMGIKEQDVTEEEYYSLHQKIINEYEWAIRVSPFDVIVPMFSRRFETLDRITQRFIVTHDEVMNDDSLDTKDLKPNVTSSQILQYLQRSSKKHIPMQYDTDYNILYEVYDRKTKKIYTLAEDHPKILQVKDTPWTFLDTKFHNFVMLRMNEVNDEFYPQSDIEPAEPQLLELNDVRTQMNTHRKRYNRKYLSKPGALDPAAKEQLRNGEDGVILELTSSYDEEPVANVVASLVDAALPPEVYAVETRIKDDLFTILGTSDYASSASGGARTATEASIIAAQSRFRVEERIDVIGRFVEQMVRNLALIAMRFYGYEKIEKIVGPDDAIFWEQIYDDEELRQEYRYEIIYGSSAPINRDVDREQFIKFYSLVKDDPYFDQVKLRHEFARKFQLENPESWLNPQIAQLIEKQRLILAQQGKLLNSGQDEEPDNVGEVPRGGEAGTLPTGQPEGLPGDISGDNIEPEIPGGRGGTALATPGV